jgi:Concanavalin A-like lectin/glucanases superfamily
MGSVSAKGRRRAASAVAVMLMGLAVVAACTVFDTSALTGRTLADAGVASDAGNIELLAAIPENWWSPAACSVRREISLTGAAGADALSAFPVLVDLDGFVPKPGETLVFADGAGQTRLAHEPVGAQAWVNVASLAPQATGKTRIFAYSCAALPATDGGTTDVWGGYDAVWHLDEPTGANAFVDSTLNHRSGTGGNVGVAGKVGGGHQFAGGTDKKIVVAGGALTLAGEYSASAWIAPERSNSGGRFLNLANSMSFRIETASADSAKLVLGIRTADDCKGTWTDFDFESVLSFSPSTWTYAVVVVAAWQPVFYVNGLASLAKATHGAKPGAVPISRVGANLLGNTLCMSGTPPDNTRSLVGGLDEVRFTSRVLSEAWVKTEFANQSAVKNFAMIQPAQRIR